MIRSRRQEKRLGKLLSQSLIIKSGNARTFPVSSNLLELARVENNQITGCPVVNPTDTRVAGGFSAGETTTKIFLSLPTDSLLRITDLMPSGWLGGTGTLSINYGRSVSCV